MRVNPLMRAIGLNTIAFALIIGIQQIIIFPVLSRLVGDDAFSTTILFVTLSTIVVNVLAGEASNVALLRTGVYRKKGLAWDATRLVLWGIMMIAVGTALVLIAGPISPIVLMQYFLITAGGMIRTFGLSSYKAYDMFDRVVLVHAAYSVGACSGLALVGLTTSPYVPFLVGEICAFIAMLALRRSGPPVRLTIQATSEYPATRRKFIQLALVSMLANLVSYLDRLIITPLLGMASLGTYYATSALSKSVALVINPASNAVLSRLGSIEDQRAGALFKRIAPLTVGAWLAFFVLSYLLSLGGLTVLYPMYLSDARGLILPISVGAASGAASALLQPLMMRFIPTGRFLSFNVGYFAVFALSTTLGSIFAGIMGFVWAVAASHFVLLLIYLCQTFVIVRQESRNNKTDRNDGSVNDN